MFAPPSGCNGVCCAPGSNSVVYVIAREARDTMQILDPRLRGDDSIKNLLDS